MSHAPSQRYAGPGRRLAAQAFDAALLAPLALAGTGIAMHLDLARHWAYDWPALLFDDLLPLLLTVLFWSAYGATPGKWLWDCEVVVAATGRRPGPLRSLARYLGYVVSLLPLGLGFLWVLWDRRRQGFHDKLAGTVVLHRETELFGEDESGKSLAQLVQEAS